MSQFNSDDVHKQNTDEEVAEIQEQFSLLLENELDKSKPKAISKRPNLFTLVDKATKEVIYIKNHSCHRVARLLFSTLTYFRNDIELNKDNYADSYQHPNVKQNIKRYIDQINSYDFENEDQFAVIKNYETQLVEKGKSNSYAHTFKNYLKIAIDVMPDLTTEESAILSSVLRKSKLTPLEHKQRPLTLWFQSIKWLRSEFEKKDLGDLYLQVASPKLLMRSFAYTVSCIYLHFNEVISSLVGALKDSGISSDDWLNKANSYGNTQAGTQNITKDIFEYAFCGSRSCCLLLKQFLLDELVISGREIEVMEYLASYGELIIYVNNKPYAKKSRILTVDFIYSLLLFIEGKRENVPVFDSQSLIFYWLNCYMTMQPTDAKKTCRSNYKYMRNTKRVTHVQSDYWKSRGKKFTPTDSVSTSTPIGAVFYDYLSKLSHLSDSDCLIPKLVTNHKEINSKGFVYGTLDLITKGYSGLYIAKQLREKDVSPIFCELIKCIVEKMESSSTGKLAGIDTTIWFGGEHIKTSAVHANSDKYRDGKLVNYNSHSSATELKSYCTPESQEFVNASGRVTRIILNDLQNAGFKPFNDVVENVKALADEFKSRASEQKLNGNVNSYSSNQAGAKPSTLKGSSHKYVVIESDETVLELLHYTEQVKKHYKELLLKAPDFLEFEALPRCVWYEGLLDNHFNLALVQKITQRYYAEYQNILPDLFTSQLIGG